MIGCVGRTSGKPLLEIPAAVWQGLAARDFVNFPVPLLNPPVERDGVLRWNEQPLLMVSETLAAFSDTEEAARRMPYDELFRVVACEARGLCAQIYGVFFRRTGGEWRMFYRLMNVSRMLEPAAMPCGADCDVPVSSWMLSATEITNWFTFHDFVDFYCDVAGYNRTCAAGNIVRQLEYLEGGCVDVRRARVLPTTPGIVVLVPRTTRCAAVMFDIVRNRRIALFAMDDPPHLIARFWRLQAKLFLNAADRLEMMGMENDARHFARALQIAREEARTGREVTAAAFYC